MSAIHRTAQRAQPAVAAILDRIRASPVVHADETGWRQSGANGYMWTFSTPTERYFLRTLLPAAGSGQNSRGRGAERCFLRSIGQRLLRCLPPLRWPQAGLYAKSNNSNGCPRSGAAPPVAGVGRFFTVRSWPRHSGTPGRAVSATRRLPRSCCLKCVKSSQAAVLGAPAAGHPRPAPPLPQRRRTGPMGGGSPPALCRSQSLQPSRAMAQACCPTGLGAEAAGHRPAPFLSDPSAVQGKLCRRIKRHIKSLPRTGYGELFVFVAEPAVPSDNNPAERSLRHLVISRKVSGGTRSEQGTERKMTLASLFGTWRAQGLNPLAACRQLLVSPLL